MQRLLLLWIPLFLWAPVAFAESGLEKAFGIYVRGKQAEERLRVAAELSPSSDRPEEEQALGRQLREARAELQNFPKNSLSPWESSVLEGLKRKPANANRLDEAVLDFLKATFPEARKLSALEWEAVADWFGTPTQEAFLKWAFEANQLPEKAAERKERKVVWVMDPFRNLFPESGTPEKADLEKLGAEPMEISAFSRVEDQAEELRKNLLALKNIPYVLVSNGEASAVVHKLLDLHPSFRERPELVAWINLNGRLYGRKPAAKRGLASHAERFESEAVKGLKLLRLERIHRPAPLGKGFPIFNVITTSRDQRPSADLRESLVMDGSFWFTEKGSAPELLPKALSLLP